MNYVGPSYKRGPPKGYIHAIEQRWQTIESLLGAIMACPDPGVQDILSRLRRDELARDILNMVDMGPFVSVNLFIHVLSSYWLRVPQDASGSQMLRPMKTHTRKYSKAMTYLPVMLQGCGDSREYHVKLYL